MAKAKNPNGGFKKKKVLILDISRAHSHPPAKRKLFIRIPPKGGGGAGLLLRTMYGMRDAAARWGEYRQERPALAGYKASISCPYAFTDSDRSSSGAAHGHDF
eukprot:5734151-Pyramimonas_sp.AAC.1